MTPATPFVEPFRSTWWHRAAYLFEEVPLRVGIGSVMDICGVLGAVNHDAFTTMHDRRRWLDDQLMGLTSAITDVRPLLESLIISLDSPMLHGYNREKLLSALHKAPGLASDRSATSAVA